MGRRPVGHGRPRLLAAVFVAVAMLAAPTLAPAVTTPATPVDHTRAVNVNPPGENGFVPGTDTGWIKYALNGGYPYNESKTNFGYPSPHTVDQIDDYWHADPNRRIFPGYKDANFYDPAHPGAGDTVERLGDGAVIYRDARRGIPRIFAADKFSLLHAVGVAEAEDRLGQAELFRRAGYGRLSEILGPGMLPYDYERRLDTYSRTEFAALTKNLPADEYQLLQAFSAGMNEVIKRDILGGPAAAPAELVALDDWPPRTTQSGNLADAAVWYWTPQDTYAIASLMVQSFGDEGGAELGHLAFYCWLQSRYGASQAQQMFLDRLWTQDGLAPPSVPGNPVMTPQSFTLALAQARVDGCAANGNATAVAARQSAMKAYQKAVTDRLGLPHWGSNAIAVAPSKSATGNAFLYGAPQVGYNIPSLFLEQEWHGGGFNAIGLGFAGIPGILIGHGPDFAWTTTSGQTDMLDTYIAIVKPDSSASWFRGAWVPTERRTENIFALTSPASASGDAGDILRALQNRSLPSPPPLPPGCSETPTVGVVLARCSVIRVLHPDPYATPYAYQHHVAMVIFGYSPRSVACPDGSGTNCRLAYLKRRAWSEREAGTFAAFANYGRLDSFAARDGVSKLDEFAKMTSAIVSSHNLVYADDQGNIGYWLGGSYPLRPAGIVTQLPLDADGTQEWGNGSTMYVPFAGQPQSVNPAQGWVASWNNKPSNQASFASFDTGDDTKWGLQHHVEAIEGYLSATGKLEFNGVAQAGYRAAFNDTRAKWVMPILLHALEDPSLASQCSTNPAAFARLCPRLSEVTAALTAWYAGDSPIAGGAERTWFNGIPSPWWDQSHGWRYDSGAQALWDSWWNVGMELAFHHWFDGTPSDYPGPSGDSMENHEDSFFIHALLGPSGTQAIGTLAPRFDYLSGSGGFPGTQQAFDAEVMAWAAKSMNDTLAWLAAPASARPAYVRSGLPDASCCATGPISSWRENMIAAGDMNCFSPFGVYSAPCMPWEDKGTYAQVVEVMRSPPH